VTCASSALNALEILESADEDFDVAILDWHMPEVDGVELARQIREEASLHDLRIMMLSSLADSLDEAECNELCISTQITKPVRQSDLFNALLNLLSSSGDKPEPSRRAPTGERKLTGRVLLAEDNVVNQAVAVGMLEHMGLEVEVAANGEVAAEKVASDHYDVVLMDCQMPVLDGFDATRRIRERELESFERPVAIVALTANALKGDREKCLEAGMNDYLSKPFTAEELYSVLTLWIGREPGPDGAANEDVAGDEQRAAQS
jgi:CheY-like chemotaxis protein